MTETEAVHGLACPNCGGMVPIPEGQVIVRCPFCDLRSMVRGERGLQRYQVPQVIDRAQAVEALGRFLRSSRAIASGTARNATLQEAFVVYLPFWAGWARVLGWVFGEKQVGSGDNRRYKPREVQTSQDMSWNGAACDVGEFGVSVVSLDGRPLEPFDPDILHERGLVFEPVGSASDARSAAESEFRTRIRESADLDRVAQVFTRMVRQRLGLVYYPLWVLRYLYRGRAFQVVVDGFSGELLYGKAPGSTLYRAAVLIGGMAVGSLLAVDCSAIAFYLASKTDGDAAGGLFGGGVLLLALGVGLIIAAYRTFLYGEQYEYRQGGESFLEGALQPKVLLSKIEEVGSWIE